ncbi:Chromosome partition protein Smc [uncultured Gammaproteobacteria bacterium]
MDFVTLRLTGFKSFVDPTDLPIEAGVTGIVGPNGCGKSNLVEALRWVMGETSARKMRGDEMDDVIFGGTAKRPPRNIAEVGLLLHNHARTAPAAFNDNDELEITRRIERGSGSDYRINGRLVRARDVQLLFADQGSGSSSPALVSQGKVGALIGAKPTERRLLLEEAAGIAGLHSRRHEAELRLKGAEGNLTRLDDVIGAMETNLQGLKKQARQATRYRNLSDLVRRAEAVLMHLRWTAAGKELDQAHASHAHAEERVQTLMLEVTQLTSHRTGNAAGLPELRQAEAAAAAALQRLVLAREELDAEERRVKEATEANRRRLAQAAVDLQRERLLADDAGAALARLSEEQETLTFAQEEELELHEAATEALAEVCEAVERLDRELTRLTEQVAADEARRTTLTRQGQDLDQRLTGLDRRLVEQRQQRAKLEQELSGHADLTEAEEEVAAAEERLEHARHESETAERDKQTTEHAQTRSREAWQAADSVRARLDAERKALTDLLADQYGGNLFPPLIDAITVAPGFEGALAAALGDDLTAPLNEAATVHWRTLPPLALVASLPDGVEPLGKRVKGPPALSRQLAHLGVVADTATGQRLAETLAPGQTLVSRDGGAWRWDGFTVAAGAPTPAAARLKQRNRLEEVRQELAVAEEAVEAAAETLDDTRQAVSEAAVRDRRCRDAVREAFTRLSQIRDQHTKLAREAAAATSRLTGLTEAVERLETDRAEAERHLNEARTTLAALPEAGPARERLAEARVALAERRTIQSERQNRADRLSREAQTRRQRLVAIEAEQRSWAGRRDGAGGRVEELDQRTAAAQAELGRLADRPAEIDADRQRLLSKISEADRARKRAADALVMAENGLGDTEKRLKVAENGLADAREARARAEAAVASAMQSVTMVQERIHERLDCTPEQVPGVGGFMPDEELPEPSALETRLERLARERENMGPVNLRAEMEAVELGQQIEALQTERSDLTSAIARLRGGITSLNREARERLLESFHVVNRHFQDLFVKLFGGGRAYLELTDAEDPLEAGLEIFASPPGKRLQVLSLLSGGEQALTALSLVFAVFMTNPAPICVLDEVDAPLDEANVGRFIAMVQEMGRSGATRFLVITHHRLTMARVDRLFGVTMSEQGISQLVSVDLRMAEALRAIG